MTYLPGETVRVSVTGKVAKVIDGGDVNWAEGDWPELRLDVESDEGGVALRIPLKWPTVAIERVTPADGEPQPGDVWKDRHGLLWFGGRHWPDYDNKADCEGMNEHGWRPVLIPVNVGEQGSAMRPEDTNRIAGPLTLVHREETPEPSVDEEVPW